MSMLRMSPDSIHGVPLAKSVSVGLEMLDCIEAFHRHGYVHRDIKASNFALSAVERHLLKQQRYNIIDFGLSRQHIGEDRQVLPARPVAEFRGTSMYASLSSHRRQELGPKDDLWSWFYLVMDFLRGELPWATDAQLKNRQTVLSLKEHYTELNPGLLVEGLPGAMQLLEMMDYLQSLKYEDLPDYAKIRKQLRAVRDSSLVLDNSDSGGEEVYAYKKANHVLTPASEIDWDAIDSERERALTWTRKADELTNGDGASHMLLAIAKRYKTFFDSDGLSLDERVRVQSAVYHIEKKLRTRSSFLAPPPIQSFVKRRQSEQKMRSDALRKRREKDLVVRQFLETKNDERTSLMQGSREELPGVVKGEGTTELQSGINPGLVPPERFMADLGSEVVRTRQKDNWPEAAVSASNPQGSLLDERHHMASRPTPQHQLPYTMPLTSPTSRRDRIPNHGGAAPPPLPPPGMSSSLKRLGAFEHRFPPPLTGPANSHKPLPPAGFPPNDTLMHRPPPSPRSAVPEHRYTSAPVRHQSTSVETRSDGLYSYQRSLKSPRERNGLPSTRLYTSETREDRGYSAQGIQKSPREFVPSRHHDASKETREDHGYSRYQRSQNSPLASDRRFDSKREISEDRGYGSYHHPSRSTEVLVPDGRYAGLTTISEDRGYGPRKAQEPSSRERHEQYRSGGVYKHPEKERYSEGKRSRSHSRSPRHRERHYRRCSYSRSSSRSRSRSLSYSGSSSRSRSQSSSRRSHSHRRTDHYADRHPVTRREGSKRGHPSRQRSRSRSSSRSSSSMSTSPPTKHYRRRSPEPSHSESSRRRSSHVTSSHRSYSNDHPKEYVTDRLKGYAKGYPKEYVNDHPKEYTKGYPKEYVNDHPKVYPGPRGYPKEHMNDHPEEYTKGYSKEYVNDHPKEYLKGYQNEYVGNVQERVKSYSKEHGIEYLETYPSKSYPTEHEKDYRRRSPLPEGRNSYLQQPQYRHSPSQNRHSLSREHSRGDGSWAGETRAKPIAAPEKHRRSTRWQPRP
uniref:Casein kinase I n=1 Tax=Hyaloperonospora arabidopsidis (strain Emoy2) TaxID=559515 RepID=M4BC92_HYAAE